MPIHIGDYKRDTGHLRAAGHGAYLLLMFHHWSTGSLPDDDEQLAAIACMTKQEWKKHKPILAKFFKGGPWVHGRIVDDLKEANETYEKLAAAGSKGGKARAERKRGLSEATSEAQARLKQPITDNQDTGAKAPDAGASVDPSIAEREFFQRGREVLGKNSGGQLAKLKAAKGHNVSLARATIETAATKQNPAEYVAAVIRGPPVARAATVHQQRQAEGREVLNELAEFNARAGCGEDSGILRLDPGDGPEGIRGGPGGNLIEISPSRDRSRG